jgi:hypothetical protein
MNVIMFLYPHRFFTVAAPSRQGLLPTNMLIPHAGSPASTSSSTTALSIAPSQWSLFQHQITRIRTDFLNTLRGKYNGLFGDEWFYFHFWLAGEGERREMCDYLDSHLSYGEDSGVPVLRTVVRWAEGWAYRMKKDRCGVERGFTVETLLEGIYGARWVERVRALGRE